MASGSPIQTLTPTRAAATWSATPASLSDGTYTVTVTQTDAAGNVGTSDAVTFTVDTTAPTATNLTTTNGATGPAGLFDLDDTITFTYSEAMDPASIVTGWDGTGTQAVMLNFTNGTTDTLAITNAGATVHLASAINLNATYLKKNWATTGVLTRTSATSYTVKFDVTPGNNVATKVPAGGANIAWTPDTAAKDLAGNAAPSTTFTQTDNGVDF